MFILLAGFFENNILNKSVTFLLIQSVFKKDQSNIEMIISPELCNPYAFKNVIKSVNDMPKFLFL